MILKASQRAGGNQLALHLLKTEENEHVELHEIRGFVSDHLQDAFREAYAVSRGTRCKQFLFSLSLSPPQNESVPVHLFEKAIADIEQKLGLTGQPRAIVFHEKEGRRHCHAVWSRIDVEQMKAVHLPHFKLKLRDISRQLYLENNWQMPRGLMNSNERDPLNFDQAEWQQAKRIKQEPRQIKQSFQDCWAVSDSRAAFKQALQERGYYLAKGDRRGHVAVDWRGEVYAVSRMLGIKAKDVKERLGAPDDLPSVNEAKQELSAKFSGKLKQFAADEQTRHEKAQQAFEKKRLAMAQRHRQVRTELKQTQAVRWTSESKARSAHLPRGLKALWFRVTGKYAPLKKRNEDETVQCKRRDDLERQVLIDRQQKERRTLQHEALLLRHSHNITLKSLNREIAKYLKLSLAEQNQEKGLVNKQNVRMRRNRQRRRQI